MAGKELGTGAESHGSSAGGSLPILFVASEKGTALDALRILYDSRMGRLLPAAFLAAGLLLGAVLPLGCAGRSQTAAETRVAFLALLGEYLDSYYEFHPSWGTMDGVHTYEDRGLDDVSAAGVAREVKSVEGFQERLSGIDRSRLQAELAVDHDIFSRMLEARLYQLEVLKPYSMVPTFYTDIIETAVNFQMVFAYPGTTPASRMQVVLRQLDDVPALCSSAVENLDSVSEELLEYGIEMLPYTRSFLADDLPSAFEGVELEGGNPAEEVLAKKVEAANAAIKRLEAHLVRLLERPGAKPSFALGDRLAEKVRLEQGIELPEDDPFGEVLASTDAAIAEEKQAFSAAARAIDPGREPRQVWAEVQTHHPAPGQVAAVASGQVDGIKEFLERNGICWLPTDETVEVKAAEPFMLYWYASMWQTGAFEKTPAPPGVYYVSDPAGIVRGEDGQSDLDAQNEFLEGMVTPELWSTSAHEAYPGHFLQGYWAKRVKRERVDTGELSSVGVSMVFAPFSYYEGWAHYCEQMVREEGLMRDAPPREYQEYLMGQSSDSLLRLCRTWSGIKMHTEEMTVEEAAEFFEENAYITTEAAEAEAIRGAYDPDYILYSMGKMMILDIRKGCREAVEAGGGTFDIGEFHDRFLSLGQYPLPVLKEKMLGGAGAGTNP